MHRSMKILAGIALLFSTTACGAEEAPLTLTPNGLGALGGLTAYSVDAVAEALPGHTVTAEQYGAEGDLYPMLVVRNGDKVIAEVLHRYGDEAFVGAIIIRDPNISYDNRISLGDTYDSLTTTPTDCVAGLEENSGMALCRDGKYTHIGLNFGGDWAGPDGELPPASVLATFTVKEIIWSAGVL